MLEPKRASIMKLALLRILFVASFCFFGTFSSFCQKPDSAKVTTIRQSRVDSLPKIKVVSKHSPAKAALFSAVLPGLGQAYNHKYWKIPIVYVGLGAMTYFIIFNQQQYNTYNSALKIRTNGGIDPYYNIYTTDALISARDYYHRFRDLSVIGFAAFYLLNVVDAEVDAQLFTFNISDDISMRFSPQVNTYAIGSTISVVPTLSVVVRLK
jgi:hypothetical protein